MNKKIAIGAAIIIIFDQIIKYLISTKLPLDESISIIQNFFAITYVQNLGAAWSILSGNRYLLIIIAIFCLGAIYFCLIKRKNLTRLEAISYSALIGGIIGNLIDRILYGYVIDYLNFYILDYNFPVFNLADICIVVSIFLIMIMTIKGSDISNEEKSRNRHTPKN